MKNICRRDFLKGTAAAIMGLTFSSVSGCASAASRDTETAADDWKTAAVSTEAAETAAAKEAAGYEPYDALNVDFVVVGSGMAGMSGAVQAAQLGMSVVVLEKNSFLGGSTNVAEGIFGMNSRIQRDAGHAGTLPTVAELLKETQEYHHYNANTVAIQRFYEESGANIDWLADLGCPIEANAMPGMKDLRHGYIGKGAASIEALSAKADELGITILTETTGKELILDNGTVTGIYAEDADGILQINAKAVYLATGGYAGNPEMLKKYAHIASGDFIKDCGVPGRTGDGIQMALAAGGKEWTHRGGSRTLALF